MTFLDLVKSPLRLQVMRIALLMLALAATSLSPARAQMTQQGPVLVGSGMVGAGNFGWSVAMSADGNTAIVGGLSDNAGAGAAWVYTRNNGTWVQQAKLVGTGAVGAAQQGYGVALSADGNTAAVGGGFDNGTAGAVWVYTRSGGSWSQQAKLVASGNIGNALVGTSVGLSSDGNTLVAGGENDNGSVGAAWVWTRGGSTWTQQAKLVGSGASGTSEQGAAVAISGDGGTVLVGGLTDNANHGAVWVYTRSGSTWTQQGAKLVGGGEAGGGYFGIATALSADGNTALVGGDNDNGSAGAAWAFTRSGGTWTQQGAKLVGSGAVGTGYQGSSVSLSADGNTALEGGRGDNNFVGASWLWTRSGSTWTQQNKLIGSGGTGASRQGVSVALSANGSTAAVGGYGDNGGVGAGWMFVTTAGFAITASAGAHGSISPAGVTSLSPGTSQGYTITPDPCYSVADVLVDGVSVGAVSSYTFPNVSANHTIVASFVLNTYPVTASAGSGGAISPAGVVPVNCGASQSFSITPGSCYSIAGVLVDGSPVGAASSYTFNNVQAAHTISATFTLNTFTITASAGANGSISPTGATVVNCGASRSFTITPSPCYHVADVQVDGASVGAVTGYTFTGVGANHTISATFAIDTYTVTASAGANGSITPSGTVSVNCGASQSFTITPAACYHVADVLVDGVSVGAVTGYTFTGVGANHTIAATFAIDTYTVTASAGANGSITPSGATVVNCGSSPTFTITPNACYHVADVLVDGASVGPVTAYTFTSVSANHTISATFALDVFTITASAGTNGSMTPSGTVSVNCGASQSFTITPNACCHVSDVQVDGISVGAVTSYTFTSVGSNHTITATFAVTTYPIVATAGSGGTINPSGVVAAACGIDQSFIISPLACSHVVDVQVDGVSVGAVTGYTFTNVQASHTITASFAPNASSIAAVTSLSATQVKAGNDASGTTRVTLGFTAPPGAATVEVWRRGFGSYPLYDTAPGTGAAPSPPSAYPPAGWTLTPVSATGQGDHPASRDYVYYVAYARDSCGNVSAVSNMTTGTLDYHLGDVSDGTTPGQGENVVDIADLSLLGAHYGQSGAALAGLEYLDVGPTSDVTTDGRPTPDGRLGFEDLILMALNFTPQVGGPAGPSLAGARPHSATLQPAGANSVTVQAPAQVQAGESFDVPVLLTATRELQAVSVTLAWDPARVEPVGVAPGELVAAAGAVMLSPGPGRADAAVLGTGSGGFAGTGAVAIARFRALAPGEPAIRVAGVLGRDAANRAVSVSIGAPVPVASTVSATDLLPVTPNPTRGTALVQYSLARPGAIDLSIYSVDGRRVRTLVHGVQDAGLYGQAWDGADESGARMRSGIYYVRLLAPALHKTRIINLVR